MDGRQPRHEGSASCRKTAPRKTLTRGGGGKTRRGRVSSHKRQHTAVVQRVASPHRPAARGCTGGRRCESGRGGVADTSAVVAVRKAVVHPTLPRAMQAEMTESGGWGRHITPQVQVYRSASSAIVSRSPAVPRGLVGDKHTHTLYCIPSVIAAAAAARALARLPSRRRSTPPPPPPASRTATAHAAARLQRAPAPTLAARMHSPVVPPRGRPTRPPPTLLGATGGPVSWRRWPPARRRAAFMAASVRRSPVSSRHPRGGQR